MRSISGICGAIVVTVCLAPGVQAQDAAGQSSGTSTTTAEAPKQEKQHVTTQKVVESTTTVKPEKQHVTTQRVVEHTTTVKPEKQHVTKQRVVEDTTTVQVQPQEPH